MRSLAVLLLLAACRPAAAQVLLGAEPGPDAFARSEAAAVGTLEEENFAAALSAEVSSSVLCSVFESTAPAEEMTGYLRRGIYRQELAALLLLSERTNVPFKKLAGELTDGGFTELAGRYKADAMALFAAAGRLKAAAETRLSAPGKSPAAAGEVPVPASAAGEAPAVSTNTSCGQPDKL